MIKPIYCDLSKELEDYIIKHGLNGRLPALSSLSKKFGVHHVTMSKAIKLLEKKGLLTINGTRGTFINQKSNTRPTYKVIGVVGLSHFEERDYFIGRLNSVIKKSGYTSIGITISNDCFEKNPELLSSFPVDGFIFFCSSLTSNIAKHLHQDKVPFVVCNRRPDINWINTVDFDHASICSDILKYLNKFGHRRIAYVSPASAKEYLHHAKWMRDILQGIQQHDFDDKLFYDFPITWQELHKPGNIVPEVRRMLHYFASLDAVPTVIIAPFYIAREALEQIRESGLNCPQDISIFFYGITAMYDEDIAYSFFDYDKLWLEGATQLMRMFGNMNEQPVSKLLKMPVTPGATVGKVPSSAKYQAIWGQKTIPLQKFQHLSLM